MNESEQPAETGAGAFFERRYTLDIQGPRQPASELMAAIKARVEYFSPDLLADFEKVKGPHHGLRMDDEFRIRILGPWNGSVRVSDMGDTFFEFVTLEGHPEAGRIRFSAEPHPTLPDALRFEIHSWACSRDGLVAFMYDTLGIGQRVQEQTWRLFCERVATAAGGEPIGPVQVETIKRDKDASLTE